MLEMDFQALDADQNGAIDYTELTMGVPARPVTLPFSYPETEILTRAARQADRERRDLISSPDYSTNSTRLVSILVGSKLKL